MSSFNLYLDGNVLRTSFGDKAENDQIAKDVVEGLEKIDFPGGPLLYVDGESSLIAGYAIMNHVGNRYDAIAVRDPKLRGEEHSLDLVYVVTKCGTSTFQLGEYLALPQVTGKLPLKVVLCGPPHTGKSCLREGLKQAILAKFRQTPGSYPYPYILTACPDGEGSWFFGAAAKNKPLADELKNKYQAKFTPEFAAKTAGWLRAINLPLTIVDVGGCTSPENCQIMEPATHAIVLWREDKLELLQGWLEFCEKLDLKVIAVLKSDHNVIEDEIVATSPVLEATVHRLERGQDCSVQPAVMALADHLIQLVAEAPQL
jgi:CRISPR-associated protein Csx3